MSFSLASAIASATNVFNAHSVITDESITSPALNCAGAFNTFSLPSSPCKTIRKLPSFSTVVEFSVPKKSPLDVSDRCFRIRRPNAHAVRVCLGVILYRFRSTAIAVSFSEDRVYGTSESFCVLFVDSDLFVRFWLGRIISQSVALILKLSDRGFELRDRGKTLGSLIMLASGLLASSPS